MNKTLRKDFYKNDPKKGTCFVSEPTMYQYLAVCLSVSRFVCMNAYNSIIIKARDINFGKQVYAKHTHKINISNFRYPAHSILNYKIK